MKILYWNVNGARAVERKNSLRPLIAATSPDVVGIQEIKAKPEQLIDLEKNHPDFYCFWNSAQKPGYSGTGILVNKTFLEGYCLAKEDVQVDFGIVTSKQFSDDVEGRCQCLNIKLDNKAYAILNIYFPNGGKSPDAWQDKLKFYEAMLEYVNIMRADGKTVIWGGDVNCAHHEIDLARAKDNEGVIGFHPQERQWLTNWLADNWIDIFRTRNPEKVIYSWWHMVTRARERNVGWRIDYVFTDKSNQDKIKSFEYLNDVFGSDHCPMLLDIEL